ncbi:MAG: HAMP domain-containing sensor histidine kinase [Perlabentimonas sp.]
MKERKVKLLTKTTLIYLIFILVAFFSTAGFIIKRTNQFIQDDTEHYFQRKERRLFSTYRKGEFKLDEVRGLERLSNVSDTLEKNYPHYKDTTIYISQMDETLLFRVKTILVELDGELFKYKMHKSINDFDKFKHGLVSTIVHTFIILAVILALFSFFLSGLLFRPFHKLLALMAKYKVGRGISPPSVNTSTSEFMKMQELFTRMIHRIEDDYKNLKEYTENMAHEMQTPLAITRSKTELLISDNTVMDKHASTVKTIYDEVNQLSNLSNTLNLLTKIENGEYNNVLDIKTDAIINRHIEAVREMIELKGFSVDVSLDTNHTLNIDPYLFDIMIKNLMRNALRYGDTDEPIKIETEGNKLVISNKGKPLAFNPDKIFQRFVGSNGSKYSLGLGLALVKRICDINQLDINYAYINQHHTFTIISPKQ